MRGNGFTMIELLVVIALIMILSSVGLGAYTISTTRSYDTQRKSDLNQMSKAIESFNSDIGRYPLSDANGAILCYQKDGSTVTNPACPGSKLTIRIDGVVTSYITIPTDPDPSNKYIYDSDGNTYSLYTKLHNLEDKDLIRNENDEVIENPYNVTCGTDPCNYKITEVGLSKTNE